MYTCISNRIESNRIESNRIESSIYIVIIVIMLFRDANGNLVEINRQDFKNDELYYQKIMELYTLSKNSIL